MYIVSRSSFSGGAQYVVEGVATRYRWDKVAKNRAHVFGSKSAASAYANRNQDIGARVVNL